ncbi:MAG: tetratricopeptide repeat protein, partial [Planctomycetota bacterium]
MNEHFLTRHVWAICLAISSIVLIGGLSAAQEQENETDAATKQLMAANGLLRRGYPRWAAQDYEDFLQKYPGHPKVSSARYGLAACHYELNEYEKAAGHLQELVKDRKFKQRHDALAMLGHCLFATKSYEKALGVFDELLSRYPK